MKVAYVLATHLASTTKLATMILPQLEQGTHGTDVVGLFFFDDNLFSLRAGDPVGERLAAVAKRRGMLLMVCDQCAVRRNLAEGTFEQCGSGQVEPKGLVEGVQTGCFPQLCGALAGSPPTMSSRSETGGATERSCSVARTTLHSELAMQRRMALVKLTAAPAANEAYNSPAFVQHPASSR